MTLDPGRFRGLLLAERRSPGPFSSYSLAKTLDLADEVGVGLDDARACLDQVDHLLERVSAECDRDEIRLARGVDVDHALAEVPLCDPHLLTRPLERPSLLVELSFERSEESLSFPELPFQHGDLALKSADLALDDVDLLALGGDVACQRLLAYAGFRSASLRVGQLMLEVMAPGSGNPGHTDGEKRR